MIEEKGISNYVFKNWSNTFSCIPEQYFEPTNVETLREIILLAKENNKKLRVVGCGRSPSDIVCTRDYMVSLKHFNRILAVDNEKKTAKVEAGITINKLNIELEKNGLALSVLGSIGDITIGGAVSVAIHGSGIRYNVISNYITELELLTSSGDLIKCSREENNQTFLAALCGLGAIGIIVNLVIQCESSFMLHTFTQPSTLDDIIDDIYDYMESEHLKIHWFPHTNNVLVSHSNRIYNTKPTEYSFFERICNWIVNYGLGYYALEFSYWVASYIPQFVPLINRLFYRMVYAKQEEKIEVSYKAFHFECLFSQYVTEWSIPIESAGFVLLQMRKFIETNKDVYAHFPVEIRFVKGDEIYLSPAFGRDSCYINIIAYRPYGKHVQHKKYWRFFEQTMKEVGGRPHWAKAHNETSSDLMKMYPFFKSWNQIRKRMDPISMFTNDYLERILSINDS